MKGFYKYIYLLLLLPAVNVSAHHTRDVLYEASKLRKEYEFKKAISILDSALKVCNDSVYCGSIREAIAQSKNAENMRDYCASPKVIAKHKFALKDFFLFYPLEDKSWRALPNQLDSLSDSGFPYALYFPPESKSLYYSAKDENGIRNIYTIKSDGKEWSTPKLINENITSSSDEIFPMLSDDGKKLYFSSKGLYGIGGYDLYVSRWNEEQKDWDEPVNMGFPYSSPYDDFLFVNSPDCKYSIFASNRETSEDSVYVYVLEYDNLPIRKKVSGKEELVELMKLNPIRDISLLDNNSAVASSSLSDKPYADEYAKEMSVVRTLNDSISSVTKTLDKKRSLLTSSADSVKESISQAIIAKEFALQMLQDSLSRAVERLQNVEMEFLTKGIQIDPAFIREEAAKEVVGASSSYTFSRNSMGGALKIDIHQPKSTFDYSLKILSEGQYAEDNDIPEGLIYQIKLFSSTEKVPESRLKGISPVFYRKENSKMYNYYAGIFTCYEDVLANLNKVKKAGFSNAFITAFMNRARIPIRQAKSLEKSMQPDYFIEISSSSQGALSEGELSVIRSITNVEISLSSQEGAFTYILGPFKNRLEAEKISTTLVSKGFLSKVK